MLRTPLFNSSLKVAEGKVSSTNLYQRTMDCRVITTCVEGTASMGDCATPFFPLVSGQEWLPYFYDITCILAIVHALITN